MEIMLQWSSPCLCSSSFAPQKLLFLRQGETLRAILPVVLAGPTAGVSFQTVDAAEKLKKLGNLGEEPQS